MSNKLNHVNENQHACFFFFFLSSHDASAPLWKIQTFSLQRCSYSLSKLNQSWATGQRVNKTKPFQGFSCETKQNTHSLCVTVAQLHLNKQQKNKKNERKKCKVKQHHQ